MKTEPIPNPNPMYVKKTNIWSFRQNRPTLVARDFFDLFGIPFTATYRILLARGVLKWLSVRRDLIKTKDAWRARINTTLSTIRTLKTAKVGADERSRHRLERELAWQRGYLAALNECRQDVRRLCHSDRWRAPDFDREATRFLQAEDRPPLVQTVGDAAD